MNHQTVDIRCDYAAAGIPRPDYQPKLHLYFPEVYPDIDPLRKRATIIICPGGGFVRTSVREGEHIALRFAALGFNAAILKYSCKPAIFPAPQLELATAIALVRTNAKKWHADPARVIVMGFSAGGHVAASLGVFWNTPFLKSARLTPAGKTLPASKIRPDALVLCYPVITSGEFAHRGSFRSILGKRYDELLETVSLEKQVNARTPPAFIWHTQDDQSVPVENALLFASALRKNRVPFELYIYQSGVHGLAAANSETRHITGWGVQAECQNWIDMAATWMRNLPGKILKTVILP